MSELPGVPIAPGSHGGGNGPWARSELPGVPIAPGSQGGGKGPCANNWLEKPYDPTPARRTRANTQQIVTRTAEEPLYFIIQSPCLWKSSNSLLVPCPR